MFNSREYQWADVTVIAGGRDLTGIRSIKIEQKFEKEAIYAKGNNPHSIQRGNNAYEGEIMVLQSELHALEEAAKKAGGSSIGDLTVDVIVGFGNPLEGNAPRFKRAIGVSFTEASEELKQGDKFAEISLPFVCLKWINSK